MIAFSLFKKIDTTVFGATNEGLVVVIRILQAVLSCILEPKHDYFVVL